MAKSTGGKLMKHVVLLCIVAFLVSPSLRSWADGVHGIGDLRNDGASADSVIPLSSAYPQPQGLGGQSVHGATGVAVLVNGFVVGIEITDAGYGYTNAPTVVFSGGGGSGALGTAVVRDGSVVEIRMEEAGFDYTSPPVVKIAPPSKPPALVSRVTRISVRLTVFSGGHYQLFSSKNLITWTTQGPDFVAQTESIIQEFETSEAGNYFKLVLLP